MFGTRTIIQKPELTKNQYFNRIYTNYLRQDLTTSTPSASAVLADLMQCYINEKGYINTRSHIADAEKCIDFIKQNAGKPDDDIIKAAFQEIDKLTTLVAGSAFTTMLSSYFSVFPEHQATRPSELQSKLTRYDFWDYSLSYWVKTFMKAHRKNKDSNKFEMLATVSKMVPASMQIEFADFLLGQLDPDIARPSKNAGLYPGWVCIALREVMDNLPTAKKQAISIILLRQLEACIDTGENISLIGITSALTKATLTSKETTMVTNCLFNYVTNKMSSLVDLFADHHKDKIKLYMPVIFDTLVFFQKQFNPHKKSTIIDLLLKTENFYALRFGISKLSADKWLSEPQSKKLLQRIAEHDYFHLLLPTFWPEIDAANAQENAPTRKRSEDAVANAKRILFSQPPFDAQLSHATDIMAFEKNVTYQDRTAIIDNLQKILCTYDVARKCNDLRKELHVALTDLACGKQTEASKLVEMAARFQQSSRPETLNTDDIRLSAARAAAKLRAHLSPSAAKSLRDDMLDMIYEDKDEDAAEVVRIFASNSGKESLPELMTCLMAINNRVAAHTLAQVYLEFQKKKWIMVNTPEDKQETAPRHN